jgi:hypothetical protein
MEPVWSDELDQPGRVPVRVTLRDGAVGPSGRRPLERGVHRRRDAQHPTRSARIGFRVSETSRDRGRLAFTLGPIAAGHSFTLYMQFQVNPTTVTWRRPQDVQLDDGNVVLASVPRTVTVYP